MPVQEAVAVKALVKSACTDSGSSAVRPIAAKRIFCRRRFSVSLRKYRRSSRIKKLTSASGRRQFSAEKAYSVSAGIAKRAQVSTVERTARTPAKCPDTRGRIRFPAQRPLPSMITAMCRGSRARSSLRSRASSPASALRIRDMECLLSLAEPSDHIVHRDHSEQPPLVVHHRQRQQVVLVEDL